MGNPQQLVGATGGNIMIVGPGSIWISNYAELCSPRPLRPFSSIRCISGQAETDAGVLCIGRVQLPVVGRIASTEGSIQSINLRSHLGITNVGACTIRLARRVNNMNNNGDG